MKKYVIENAKVVYNNVYIYIYIWNTYKILGYLTGL